ncbi:DUF1194 domain-containing protein [Octadecabacter sp. G9-8]|uniref:DUF1194 domain-containing protein n=1 Tax=Octadecabacter dasysiphoniae TaxID=2909341 RepID=A0ABS9CRS0_9RHOB|nr:DUF1194 domain-containing protein [Octadecabacter dasysiphoniae]MCF2869893.1 DUF1194 domain-containing protein [Octadecabacter dasysiphoniae]
MDRTRVIQGFRMMRVLLLLGAICCGTSVAAQSCRQALVLALDVSGSVNQTEYRQQTDGLAAALDAPDVRDLILSGIEAPVVLAVYEWSSRNHQYVIQPWIRLDSAVALDAAIARIRGHRPVRAGLKTALGTSLTFAAGMLDQQSQCWELTIDVSGDGRNNIGPTARQAYSLGGFERVTVNALVVGDPLGGTIDSNGLSGELLRSYFEDEVIRGPQAFVMVANGYGDYADAMRLKLIRELTLPMLGQLSLPRRPAGN